MFENIDFAEALEPEALIGATLPELVKVAARLPAMADSVTSRRELRRVANVAKYIGRGIRKRAQENVDVASKVGGLPTRYLGVDSERLFPGGIAPLTTQNIDSVPAVEVRATAFRTDESDAANFSLTAITLSTVNLVVGGDAVPATAFITGISLPPQSSPMLAGGSPAVLGVNNISGAQRRFRAMFLVIKVQDPAC